MIIDGAGSTVYPGLIDMGTAAGLDIDLVTQQPSTIRTFDESERWKRDLVLRSGVLAAEHVKADAPELTKLAAAGITTVLATPPGVLFKGHSALVNVVTPAESPIVGAIAPPRSGVGIVKSPVALHVQFQAPRGDGYPVALLGAIAFVRQTFIDAEYQRGLEARYAKAPAGSTRPRFDSALDGLNDTLGGQTVQRRRASRWRSRQTSNARSCGRSTWPRSFRSRRSSPADRKPTWRPRI